MTSLITVRCANGHTQELYIQDLEAWDWAHTLAGLLDGRSSLFLKSPVGTESVIGKCGICRAQLRATVAEGVPEPKEEAR